MLSLMFVYEEMLLKDHKIEVIDMIIWEGIWGMLFSAILLGFTTFFNNQPFLPHDNFILATEMVMNN